MPQPTNIQIKLHLEGFHISSKLLINSLQVIEECLYISDKEDIDEAIKNLKLHKEIEKLVKKRAHKELEQYRKRRLGFYTASKGSIIMTGAVSAIGYFILKDILLDILKEGFKESKLRKALKDHFSAHIDQKSSRIIGLLNKKTKKMKEKESVQQEVNKNQNSITITLKEAFYDDQNEFKTYDQVIHDELEDHLDANPPT